MFIPLLHHNLGITTWGGQAVITRECTAAMPCPRCECFTVTQRSSREYLTVVPRSSRECFTVMRRPSLGQPIVKFTFAVQESQLTAGTVVQVTDWDFLVLRWSIVGVSLDAS